MTQEQDPFDSAIFPCSSDQWVPDKEQDKCWSCKAEFAGGIFKSGKHHCRKCGNVICNICCKNKIRNHIVCKICYQLTYKHFDMFGEQYGSDTFKISIGIDFGTDGLGVAYAIKGDDQVYVHDKWNAKHYGTIVKPKMIILLDDEENIAAIGMDAKHSYISLANTERNKWMLFERFKMLLYEPTKDDIVCVREEKKKAKTNDNEFNRVSIRDKITSVNGLQCSSEKVFIAILQHIHKISKRYLKKQKVIDMKTVKPHEIQWIVTVPAIWNDEAKQKMKNWVIQAGLAHKNISNQCVVVYEPDCASLALLYHFKKKGKIHYSHDDRKKSSKRRRRKQNDNNKNEEVDQNKEENKYDEKTEDSAADLSIADKHILVTSGGDNKRIKSIKKQPKTKNDETKIEEEVENKYEERKEETKTEFEIGDKYILVDAGGGTVDIACHNVVGEFQIKEIFHPSGGACGSCYIDDQYIKLLEQIFSVKWIEEFKNKEPNIFVKTIHNFQDAKTKFYVVANYDTHSVELPFKFLYFLEERIAEKIQKSDEFSDVQPDSYIEYWVTHAKINQSSNLVSLDGEMLIMNVEHVWKTFLFDHVVTPIVGHIETLLNKPQLTGHCKYICLVGGLSCSPYFQSKIKEQFGLSSDYKLQIIVPQKPILSVVEGAALFGVTRNFVKARVLKCHYGIIVGKRKNDAIASNVSNKYIKKHQKKDKFRKEWYIPGCVHVLGAKEEQINVNQIKSTTAQRPNPDKPCILRIFRSVNVNEPKTIDDGTIIGTLRIEFENQDANNLQVTVEFNFSGTMIQVHAYPTKTPQYRKLFAFTYEHY